MTEVGFFVLGFTVCLAILMVSDTVTQAIAAEVKCSWPPLSMPSSRVQVWPWPFTWPLRKNEHSPLRCLRTLRRG